MNDWRQRAAALAEPLAARDGVDPQWAVAFAEVPRHVFVPRFYHDLDVPELIDGTDPDQQQEWLDGVYSDQSLVTAHALIPGTNDVWLPTSSSTRPSLIARMLTLLDVRYGHRVLEIGTGTGYDTALLCHRLGWGNVTSLDIDAQLVDLARDRMATLGQHPTLVAANGTAGLAAHGPYDRILATCAVPTIPTAWITQLRPGGLIVADLRGELTSSLLVARSNGDGTVSGQFLDEPAHLMWLRAQVDNPLRDGGQLTTHSDYDGAHATATPFDADILDEPGLRVMLQFTAPDIDQIWTSARGGRTLVRVCDDRGAWAELDPTTGILLQDRPTDLVARVENAAHLWHEHGRPEPTRLGVTVGPTGWTLWRDSPQHPITWMPTGERRATPVHPPRNPPVTASLRSACRRILGHD